MHTPFGRPSPNRPAAYVIAALFWLLFFALTVPAFASSRDCTLPAAGYAWSSPDYQRSPERTAQLLAIADQWVPRDRYGVPTAAGWMGLANLSNSNGRDEWDALVPKLLQGQTDSNGDEVRPAAGVWVRATNHGSSRKGIKAWAKTHYLPGEYDYLNPNNPTHVTDLWRNVYAKLASAKLMPPNAVPFVTQSQNLVLVRLWLVGVGLSEEPPDGVEAWQAETRADVETIVRLVRHMAPGAIIEITGQDTPQWATGRDRLAYPWNVRAEEDILRAVVEDGVDGYGNDLMFTPRLVDGEAPRLATASISFPLGTPAPCEWFASDGIHMLKGVPGVGYDAAGQAEVERWFMDPVKRKFWP